METPSKKFASAGTPQVVKEYRAELASALKKRSVSLDVFLAAKNETRFSVSRSTLFDHVAEIDRGEAPLSSEKKSGRPGALTGEQWDIVCGAILASEENVIWPGLRPSLSLLLVWKCQTQPLLGVWRIIVSRCKWWAFARYGKE
jgi:hypothetical protein